MRIRATGLCFLSLCLSCLGHLGQAALPLPTNSGPGTILRRTYDAYGLLRTDAVNAGGPSLQAADESHDAAGRRLQLGMSQTFGYSFTWREDGLLAGELIVPTNAGRVPAILIRRWGGFSAVEPSESPAYSN